MTIEERYRFILESEETGEGFDQAEEKISDLFDEVREAAQVFNNLEDNGADAFSAIAAEAEKADTSASSFFSKLSRSSIVSFGTSALNVFDRAAGAIDFVSDTFDTLQGQITTTQGALSALDRGFSTLDIAQIEQANANFLELSSVSQNTLSNIQQQIAVGVAPSLGALASVISLNATSFDGLSERVDIFARGATLRIAEVSDGLRLLFADEGEELLQANFKLALADFRNFANELIGRGDKVDEDRESYLALVDALEKAGEEFGSSSQAVEEALKAQDAAAEENRKKFEDLQDEIESTTGKLGGLTIGSNAAAAALDKLFDRESNRISGLEIEGLGDLDLSGAQLASRGLDDLEASELSRILGLDLSQSKKQELQQQLKEQIGTLGLQLELQAQLAIDEANSRSEIQDLAAQYNAQIGRDDAVQIPIALEVIDKEKAAADLQQTTANLGFLTSGLNSTAAAFGNFADAASSEGESAFKDFQRIQVAFSTAAAISAAVQSAGFAAGAGPAAAFAAYASVAGALLGAVAQIQAINTSGGGSAPARLSGGGATPSGPIGGEQAGNRFGDNDGEGDSGGTQFNFTFIGKDSDTVTLGTLRNMARALKNDEASRRAFQNILNS